MDRSTVLVGVSLALFAIVAPPALGAAGTTAVDGGAGGLRAAPDPGSDDPIVQGLPGFIIVAATIVALVVVVMVVQRRRRARARPARSRQVLAEASEAARDDPAFAPAAVKAAAAALYVDMQRAWNERDGAALERGLGPELLDEWRRRLKRYSKRGWESEREILDGPRVEYVGLVDLEGIHEDRVTVAITSRVNVTVRDMKGRSVDPGLAPVQGDIEVSEYWTLARNGEGWRAVAIEDDEP